MKKIINALTALHQKPVSEISTRLFKKKLITLSFSLLIGLGLLSSGNAYAASSLWTSSAVPTLHASTWAERCRTPCDPDPDHRDMYETWIPSGSMSGISVSVGHSATIRNNTKSTEGDNVAVTVGDSITFLPTADSGTDISWNNTGYNNDTPYGVWGGDFSGCNATTYIGSYYLPLAAYHGYAQLNLAPTAPSISHNGTAGLSCSGGFTCTVLSAGTINSVITWPATSGSFEYAYTKTGQYNHFNGYYLPTDTCSRTYSMSVTDRGDEDPTPPAAYVLSVPAQSVTLSSSASVAPSVDLNFSFLDTIKNFMQPVFGGVYLSLVSNFFDSVFAVEK